MSDTFPFTAIYVKDGDAYIAWVAELPGANTQGSTLDEARENLHEAVILMLEANRAQAEADAGGRPLLREPLPVSA